MELYKTGGYKEPIETITADRATEKSVWLSGRRVKRMGRYEKYWDSIEEAKEYLRKEYQWQLKITKKQVSILEKDLKKLEKY